ncbi:MAG: LAGLIDADG family homing endonuclease [Candidatus Limnocylindria bacterium]
MVDRSATMLAYLAGVIDGEGCIAIRKTKRTGSMKSTRYAAVITVGNTSRLLIERLRTAFSAGCVTYRYPTKTKRGAYLWTVQSHVAREVLRCVSSYLIVKREQAAVLMEFVDEFDSFKGARPGKKGGQVVSPTELARRERLYQQMRTLNRVGPRTHDLRALDGRTSVGVTAEFASLR